MFKTLYIKNRVFVVYPVVEFGNYDIPEGWENALAKPTQTGVPAQWENPNTTGFESSSEEETNLYFFHTDHLAQNKDNDQR